MSESDIKTKKITARYAAMTGGIGTAIAIGHIALIWSFPILEHISAELNRGIPKTFWMGESARVDSFMEANDAEAMFPGSARALDRSRRIWRVAT